MCSVWARDKQDYLFPVNQQSPNPVKTYNYIPIRSGFRKALHQKLFFIKSSQSLPVRLSLEGNPV